jgi:hypothetical protein
VNRVTSFLHAWCGLYSTQAVVPKLSIGEMLRAGSITRAEARQIRDVISAVQGLGFSQQFRIAYNDELTVMVGCISSFDLRDPDYRCAFRRECEQLLLRKVWFLIENPPAGDHPYKSRNGLIDPRDLEPMVSLIKLLA